MKILKNLFAVLFLVIINNSTFAQEGVERNIEWLKLNSNRLDHVHCPTSNFFGDIYDVNNEGVKLYNEAGDQQCSIKWEDIDEIELEGGYLFLISNEYIGNRPMALKFYTKNESDLVYARYHLRRIAKERSKYYNKQ